MTTNKKDSIITSADIKSFISMFDEGATSGDYLIRGDMLLELNPKLADRIDPIAWYVMNDNGKLLKIDMENLE